MVKILSQNKNPGRKKLEERIIELETKVAFQDETIELLNQTVIQQQQAIDQL
ncbi:MAG: SlyX family protein, partial [Gammaproteobacteria bacterium]|nr:SlyX family protein [Gammaproteobacteria bacterium]